MKPQFEILQDLNVVYVRYGRTIHSQDMIAGYLDYQRHPNFTPNAINISDLSRLESTAINKDELDALQKQMLRNIRPADAKKEIVLYAPKPNQKKAAQLVIDFWSPVPEVTITVTSDIEQTLAAANVTSTTLQDLLSGWRPIST